MQCALNQAYIILRIIGKICEHNRQNYGIAEKNNAQLY